MIKGLVNKIIPFSSVDGPGNRTSIFLQGCNYNCVYCHNPETINLCANCGDCIKVCKTKALSIKNNRVHWDKNKCIDCDKCISICKFSSTPKTIEMSVKEVVYEISKYKDFISGVTFSGGECTLQQEFILNVSKAVSKIGLTTFIDSNGSILFSNNNDLVNFIDGFMIDFKSFDEKEHIMLTGRSNKNVIKNIRFLSSINKLYEIRTVIVSKFLNNYSNVYNISKMIANINPNIRYKIIKFRENGVQSDLNRINSPDDDEIKKLFKVAKSNGLKNVIIT